MDNANQLVFPDSNQMPLPETLLEQNYSFIKVATDLLRFSLSRGLAGLMLSL